MKKNGLTGSFSKVQIFRQLVQKTVCKISTKLFSYKKILDIDYIGLFRPKIILLSNIFNKKNRVMSNTPKFRFQSGKLFFLVWYICTQATYTRTILTVLVKKCTIDVDLYVKFTLESFFSIFKNRTSYIHIFTVCRNYIIVLHMYLNFRACSMHM